MSSTPSDDGRRTAQSPGSSGTPPATNGSAQVKSSTGLVPTNTVTTRDGVTVKARIDPTLAVDDVVRQLCMNLKIKDPPGMFALRDDTDDLVTNDNLRKKIKAKVNLKCVVPFLEI